MVTLSVHLINFILIIPASSQDILGNSGKGLQGAVASRAHREGEPPKEKDAGGWTLRPPLLCLPAMGPLDIFFFTKELKEEPFRNNLPSLVNLQGCLGVEGCRRRGGRSLGIKANSLGKDPHIIYSVLQPETMQK